MSTFSLRTNSPEPPLQMFRLPKALLFQLFLDLSDAIHIIISQSLFIIQLLCLCRPYGGCDPIEVIFASSLFPRCNLLRTAMQEYIHDLLQATMQEYIHNHTLSFNTKVYSHLSFELQCTVILQVNY